MADPMVAQKLAEAQLEAVEVLRAQLKSTSQSARATAATTLLKFAVK